MKNFMIRSNSGDNSLGFFGDAIDGLFRPLFYDEKLDIMKTDIKENEKDYELDIELPGFDRSEINIDYEDEYLTVRAAKVEKDEKAKYVRKERSVNCQRSFYVGDIDLADVKAKYDNGVLHVTVPKIEAKKPEKKGVVIE